MSNALSNNTAMPSQDKRSQLKALIEPTMGYITASQVDEFVQLAGYYFPVVAKLGSGHRKWIHAGEIVRFASEREDGPWEDCVIEVFVDSERYRRIVGKPCYCEGSYACQYCGPFDRSN